MLLRSEMTFLKAKCDDYKHQHTHEHVKAVEASEHEKGRAINTWAQFQIHLGVCVVILKSLNAQEGDPQKDREVHEQQGFGALIGNQGVMRNGQSDPWAQQ